MRVTTKAVFDIETWMLLDWTGYEYSGPIEMLGGGQANSGQASQAASNANAASNQNLALGNEEAQRQLQMYNLLFGTGAKGSTGTLSQFLNPASLNVTNPTGAYKLNYEQTVNQTSNAAKAGQANIIRQAAANGLGLSSPAIAELARETSLDSANQKGQDFASAVTAQHNDAVNNFWNATGIASGTGNSSGSTAVGANSGAGSTASGIYSTAGAYHPSPWTNVIGAGLQAGGAVGAAALNPGSGAANAANNCPAAGMKLKTPKGYKAVELLRCGDWISQLGGCARLKVDPIPHNDVPLVKVITRDGKIAIVSAEHAFVCPEYGYFKACEADAGRRLKLDSMGHDACIQSVESAGIGTVYEIITEDGLSNRTYCVAGFWSLE